MTSPAIEQRKAELMATYQRTIERLVKERDVLVKLLRDINATDARGFRVAPMNFALQQRIDAAISACSRPERSPQGTVDES